MRRDQLESLHFPRVCVDENNNIVDRFVTDDDHKSGRLYDRLYRVEVPRIVPCMEHTRSRCIYDVLKDQIRDRIMQDDFLDSQNLSLACSNLEISREECRIMYYAENGYLDRDPMDGSFGSCSIGCADEGVDGEEVRESAEVEDDRKKRNGDRKLDDNDSDNDSEVDDGEEIDWSRFD
jgi:hypothetical protein